MTSDREEHWESHVAQYFPQCPLCGSKSLDFDVEYGSVHDYIYCQDCKARWEIDWKGDDFKIEYAVLLEAGDSEKYTGLINEKHSPEFWLEMISKANEEEQTAKAKTSNKVRCKYCQTLFNEDLDVCPYCGAER